MQEELLPFAATSARTWVNQRVSPCQQLGCMQENLFFQWAMWATYYLRELLCRREELRGFHCSETVVLFHLVFWMSFLLVLGLVWFAYRRHPAFCFSPVLLQTENS